MYADIRRLLSTLIQREIADPRLIGICITRIEPLHGGQELSVWVHRPDTGDTNTCVGHLNQFAPHFFHELRRAIPRRRLPKIVFRWDQSIESGGDMVRLLEAMEEQT